MLRPVLGVAATGVAGYVLWKLLEAVLLPLLGTAVGFVLFLLKIIFVVLLVLVAIWIFKRLTRPAEAK
jgi:hypothetical protein